jgi:reactive intermediate/imine deaminase
MNADSGNAGYNIVNRWCKQQFCAVLRHSLTSYDRFHMTNKAIIHSDKAPAAIGTYSQAVKVNSTVYLSGQIPLDPATMQLVAGDFAAQAHQVFKNLRAVCEAADGGLNHIVKLNIYLTDLANFPIVNEVMSQYFSAPYPARAAIGINQLPRASLIEADGVMVI